jgi:hypothetical protein
VESVFKLVKTAHTPTQPVVNQAITSYQNQPDRSNPKGLTHDRTSTSL